MRGDSIRDLYAKVIAVAGLGLLGALGAAVDYWPAGQDAVIAGVSARTATPPGDVASLDLPAISFGAPDPVATPVRVRAARPVSPQRGEYAGADVVTLTGAELVAPDVNPARPIPAAPIVSPLSMASLYLSTASMPVFEVPVPMEDFNPRAPVSQASEGFFASAARKTKNGLATTGTMVASAFRAVGGAFNDALKRVAGR